MRCAFTELIGCICLHVKFHPLLARTSLVQSPQTCIMLRSSKVCIY